MWFNETVHQIISEGYRIPFIFAPPSLCSKNNNSALRNQQFVENDIVRLLFSNRIAEVSEPPCLVNPLTVSVDPSGEKRLILDLSFVNDFILKDNKNLKIGG